MTRIQYPEAAKAKGIEGYVPVSFEIDEKGDVQNVRTLSTLPELEEEAMRIIRSLPRFVAATKDGQPVKVPYVVPVQFKLTKAGEESRILSALEETIVPVYPGCEDAEDKRACFSEKFLEYLTSNMVYPPAAEEEGIEGRVQVVFTINKKGKVEGVKARSANAIFEKEALRLIEELPRFEPAMRNGEAVPYPMAIPIHFKHSTYSSDQATCTELISKYSADFDQKKSDLDWVKTAVSRLYASECTGEPIFEKLFDQQKALDPSPDAYFYSGVLKQKHGDWDGALQDYKKAVELETNRERKSDYLYKIGIKLSREGSKEEAKSFLNQALELDPRNGRAKLALMTENSSSFPIFPGCEEAESTRDCFNQKMQEFISANMKYPEEAVKKKIEGRVSIVFTILKDGTIGKIAMKGSDQLLEKEAFRLVQSLPKMIPGKKHGKAVETPYSIPIDFRLN